MTRKRAWTAGRGERLPSTHARLTRSGASPGAVLFLDTLAVHGKGEFPTLRQVGR